MSGAFVYRLGPIPETGGTRVTLDAESSRGWLPGALSRLLWPLIWRGCGVAWRRVADQAPELSACAVLARQHGPGTIQP